MQLNPMPEGFISLGAVGFMAHDIPTETLEGRKAELEAAMQELDWHDYWTQSDRDWRKAAVSNLWRINKELEQRGIE